MAGETQTNSAAGVRQTTVNPQLIAEVRENNCFMGCVDWRDAAGSAAITFPRITSTASLTAITSGSAEADAVSLSQVTTTAATATPAMKAAFILASLLLLRTSAPDMEGGIEGILRRAAATLLDTDIAALFSGFSNTVGSTGVNAVLEDFRSASVTFETVAGGRSADGIFGIHQQQYGDVNADLLSGTGAGLAALLVQRDIVNWFPAEGGNRALARNYKGTLFGYPVIVSSNVGTANVGADRGGALFVIPAAGQVGAAIGGAMAWMDDVQTQDQRVNQQPAISKSIDMAYGVVEAKDEFGVSIITDA